MIEAHAIALADGIEACLPGWVQRCVAKVMIAYAGSVPSEVVRAATEAGLVAQLEVGPVIRRLLTADVDSQRTTPLAVLREAVRYPTSVLAAAGVPEVLRDRFAESAFPDDVYDLVPANFAEIDPALADTALTWGAAKAFEHRRRHQG